MRILWEVSLMRVFLTGVTGCIGGSLGIRLVHDGYEVAGLTCSPEAVRALDGLGIDPVVGVLDDPAVLRREASFVEMTQAIADVLDLGPAQPWDLDSAIAAWGYE
ncbi:MAG: hypothetical protein ACREP9_20710, partial [Candidatus Dormibacteraceae bacterium]